ncbi:MAG: protein kinase [Candidatus Brocadiia bacterium]
MPEEHKQKKYGRCLVERVIGRGARSTVYLAWHQAFQIPVAVKVMSKSRDQGDEFFSERFLREARIAAQLTHPNIVRVYDCGEAEDSYYLVLEYIEGESCRDKLDQWGAFDWQRAVQIMLQVAEGLQYAAKKGIIHRDLKPENIMIDSEGNIRIADLGLAKEVMPGRASATADGDVLGTPYYMSPEQIRQPSQVDFRSDIYSLGATLYHLASGEVPFEAPTPFEIMTKHLNEPLVNPCERRSDLPEALCDIIMKMMDKDPDERHQSYGELIKDLEELLEAEPEAEAPLEETEQEEPAPAEKRPAAEKEPPKPPPRPIKPVELPVTPHDVRAKLMGVLALLGYAFLLVCLYHLMDAAYGLGAAVGATLGVAFAAGVWGYVELKRGADETEAPPELDEQVSSALARTCERLQLPMPRLVLRGRSDPACYSYSLFSRRAALHLPTGWMKSRELTDEETEAVVAAGMAPIYNGDSDIRTLLSLPLAVLKAGGVVLNALPAPSARWRTHLAGALGLLWIAGSCALVAALFLASPWAGALALLLFAVLIFTAAFERQSRHAGDSFAVKAVDDEDPVKAVVALEGLSGAESYRVLEESAGEVVADTWAGEDLPPGRREQILEQVITHYDEAEHVPGTLELAAKLFSPIPLAAERLNRLAGIPSRDSTLAALVSWGRRAYARIMGASPREATSIYELRNVGIHAAIGAAAGLLTVGVLLVLRLTTDLGYTSFLLAVGALAAAMGVVVAFHAAREGLTSGRLAWASIVAGLSFTCVAMLGFCIVGGRELSAFAMQLPIAFLIVLAIAGPAAALYGRLGAALGLEAERVPVGDGFKTAHTILMPEAEEDRGVGRAPAQEDGSADQPDEEAQGQ